MISNTVCFVDQDSNSVRLVLTNSSFPACIAELEMRISVTFVVFKLTFCRMSSGCIHHPSLAFHFVFYTFSIVFTSIRRFPNADSEELLCISIANYDCSIACIADKTTCILTIVELSFECMSTIHNHFDKSVPCLASLLASGIYHGSKEV